MEFTKKYIRSTAFMLLCIFFFIYAIHHIGNAFKDKTELFLVTKETSENTLDVITLVVHRVDGEGVYSAIVLLYDYAALNEWCKVDITGCHIPAVLLHILTSEILCRARNEVSRCGALGVCSADVGSATRKLQVYLELVATLLACLVVKILIHIYLAGVVAVV
jgi:hypothetical protein